MAKSPKPSEMPFFPADWLTDDRVACLSLEEQGAYIRMLCHQWVSGKVPEVSPKFQKVWAKLLGISSRPALRLAASLAQFFTPIGDGYARNEKLEALREQRVAYIEAQAEAGRKGAAKVWGRHGEPKSIEDGVANGTPFGGAISGPPLGLPPYNPPSSTPSTRESTRTSSTSQELELSSVDPKPVKTRKKPTEYLADNPFHERILKCYDWFYSYPEMVPPWKEPEKTAQMETVRQILMTDMVSAEGCVERLGKILMWAMAHPFWQSQVRSLTGLRVKGKNGLMKWRNIEERMIAETREANGKTQEEFRAPAVWITQIGPKEEEEI